MDIEGALTKEHSKSLSLKIVKYVGTDKIRFKKLVQILLNADSKLAQRASWPFSLIACSHPELIFPYLPRLIEKLKEPGLHPAVPRNILRVLQDADIPEKYHGVVVDICFKVITDTKVPVAIRAFAITAAARISKDYPEIKNELIMVLNELVRFPQQPAITSRVKQSFKKFGL